MENVMEYEDWMAQDFVEEEEKTVGDGTYTPIPRHLIKFDDPKLVGLPFTRMVKERRKQPGRWGVTIQP